MYVNALPIDLIGNYSKSLDLKPIIYSIIYNVSLLRGRSESLLLGYVWRPLQRHGHGVARALSRRPLRALRPEVQTQDGPYDRYAASKTPQYSCSLPLQHRIRYSKLNRFARVRTPWSWSLLGRGQTVPRYKSSP